MIRSAAMLFALTVCAGAACTAVAGVDMQIVLSETAYASPDQVETPTLTNPHLAPGGGTLNIWAQFSDGAKWLSCGMGVVATGDLVVSGQIFDEVPEWVLHPTFGWFKTGLTVDRWYGYSEGDGTFDSTGQRTVAVSGGGGGFVGLGGQGDTPLANGDWYLIGTMDVTGTEGEVYLVMTDFARVGGYPIEPYDRIILGAGATPIEAEPANDGVVADVAAASVGVPEPSSALGLVLLLASILRRR